MQHHPACLHGSTGVVWASAMFASLSTVVLSWGGICGLCLQHILELIFRYDKMVGGCLQTEENQQLKPYTFVIR